MTWIAFVVLSTKKEIKGRKGRKGEKWINEKN